MVRNANDNVLRRFTYGNFYRWWGAGFTFVFLHNGLDGVAEQFTDDVFEMGEDIGKCGGEMTIEVDRWHWGVWWEV